MAGHSKFKNIMHRKGAQDNKRAKMFTKLVREIYVAAKEGIPDINFNPRLRSAILAARAANMPKDKIENALAKASSSNENEHFDEIRYEGYAPGGVAIIVEALTDNRNRTASEVRSAFTKFGGSLGETGSVSFLFNHVGSICYPAEKSSADIFLEAAIDFGADDCISDEEEHEIICQPSRFHEVRDQLMERFGAASDAKVDWKPMNIVAVDLATGEKILKMLDMLEDSDDVQRVIGNFELPDELLEKLEND